MPILTFWVRTPSGASARADLALRKGHFGVVQGSKTACGKVIHKMWKSRDSGFGIRDSAKDNGRESGFGIWGQEPGNG